VPSDVADNLVIGLLEFLLFILENGIYPTLS